MFSSQYLTSKRIRQEQYSMQAGFTMVEAILVAILVGLLSVSAVIKVQETRREALQLQMEAMMSNLEYMRLELQGKRNVGQLGLDATNDYIWAADQSFMMRFNADGTLGPVREEDTVISAALNKYMQNEARIGLLLLTFIERDILPNENTPLVIETGTVAGPLNLTFDPSLLDGGQWVVSNP